MSGSLFRLSRSGAPGRTCTCMSSLVTGHTVLPMFSHYFTDWQVAVMRQSTQQCTNKGREEEDCELENMDVNNADFKLCLLQMFYEEGNAFDTFVRPEGHTRYLLVSNSECKYNFFLSARKLHRAPLNDHTMLSFGSKAAGFCSFWPFLYLFIFLWVIIFIIFPLFCKYVLQLLFSFLESVCKHFIISWL